MANRRLLILAYSFPPDVEVGGQRPARFCRYLPEYGVEPIVLSIDERNYAALDRSFVPTGNLRVERTSVIRNPLRFYGAMKAGFRGGKGNRESLAVTAPQVSMEKTIGVRDHVIACFQIPDGYWGWYWPALRRAREILRSGGVSAILSTSPPVTAHLIARRLKSEFGLPWIADFRDPWRDSRSAELVPSWYLRLLEKIKKRCLASADRIICNTDRLRNQMISEFPALPDTDFVTLTNGFDDRPTSAESLRCGAPDQSVSFLHIGTLYGDRRIDGLARAVKHLRDQNQWKQGARVVFLGGEEEEARAQVSSAAPELLEDGIIEFRPRVARSELPSIMATASVLVLVQGDYELQIPAKFYEYLPAGLPMLAITKEGALSDIVKATGAGVCADPDDSEAIAAAILRVLEMQPKSPAEVASKFGKYHYRELTARLADVVHEVADKKGRLDSGREVSENESGRTASQETHIC